MEHNDVLLKVKVSLLQPMKAERWSRGAALHSARWAGRSTPRHGRLTPGKFKEDVWVPVQVLTGEVKDRISLSPALGFEPQTIGNIGL
jgi:hypothetical protein